ncbi:hypothetical protein [Bacillus cereus]|uniref:hypothetical protein n=1 Tax=Bacillus cereus TaxID=1396 RepID=UPI001F1A8A7B|nr:hypothetical protein [Bacillus cereus]BCC44625.1 hypothetical protein BCJMU01_p202 [Bacillus cereus]
MAEKTEEIFDALRGVFSEHSVGQIDEFDIAPEMTIRELFGNDVELFALAIMHFILDWEAQRGQRGYVTVQKEELFDSFTYFNDVYVYFCMILEA